MKKNFFGEVIAQPGDDPAELFADYIGVDMSDNLIAYRFVEYDENFHWTCELETEGGNTMQVHDFKSEEALRAWLESHGIDTEI